MAPPADQPPSWARPTAAFHVGRWAVVILYIILLFIVVAGGDDRGWDIR